MSKIPMFPNKFAIFASILGVEEKSVIVSGQGDTVTEAIPGCAFIFVRDDFYNAFGALWYVHGSQFVKIMEEDESTLSATNTNARCFVSFTNGGMIVKNNYDAGQVKILYRYINVR